MICHKFIRILCWMAITTILCAATGSAEVPAEVSASETMPLRKHERKVSLSVESIPLKEVLTRFAALAEMEVKLSDEMLALIDLDRLQNISIKDFELAYALNVVVANQLPDRFGENHPLVQVKDECIVITTYRADRARIRRKLPDWLQAIYDDQKVSVSLDDSEEIVAIQFYNNLTDELLSHFSSLTKLRQLSISGNPAFSAARLTHLAELQALEGLELSFHSKDKLCDEILKNVCKLPKLRTLSLHASGVTDEGLKQLERHPHLTSLHIYQEGRLTEAAVISIVKQKQLKSLALVYNVGTELGHMKFSTSATNQLESLSNLEHLNLSGQDVAPELLRFPHLKSLVVSGTEFDAIMGAILREGHSLSRLELTYRRIADDAFELLSGHPTLSDIRIRSHGMTDIAISHLFRLPNLKRVELWTKGLTDDSLTSLSKIDSLTELQLNWGTNRFTAAGLKSLSSLPKLQTLQLLIIPQTGALGFGLKIPVTPKSGPIRTELPGPQFDRPLPVDLSDLSKSLPKTRIDVRHDHFDVGNK